MARLPNAYPPLTIWRNPYPFYVYYFASFGNTIEVQGCGGLLCKHASHLFEIFWKAIESLLKER